MLRKLWWGQYPLWQSFWLFYALGFIVVAIVVAIIDGFLLGAFIELGVSESIHKVLVVVGVLLSAAIIWGYWLAASLGVWRSANAHSGMKIYSIAAKCIVLLYAAVFFYRLATGGLERFIGILDGSVVLNF